MRIALLIDESPELRNSEAVDLALSHSRVALLPYGDPLTIAIWRALRQPSTCAPQGFMLSATPLDESGWDRLSSPPTHSLDPNADEIVEDWIAAGSHLQDDRQWDQARHAFEQADRFMALEHSPRRASVLVCVSEIEKATGHTREAVEAVEHALAIFPSHRGALRARLDLATEQQDQVTCASMLSRMVPFADSDDQRVDTLRAVADHCLLGACDSLEQALSIHQKDPKLLERLRAVLEAMGHFEKAVNAGVALAETLASPADRARALVAAADMCARRVGNVRRAVALYEAAIADEPMVVGAFEAIEEVLLAEGDYAGAEQAYVRQLGRLAGREARDAEILLLDKLAHIREEKTGNRTGAIQALDRLVVLNPSDIEVRIRLAGLLEAEGHDDLALRCLEVAAQLSPTRALCFAAIQRIAARRADHDRSYTACAVLVHLGEADLDEQMVYQQYAPETVLPGCRSVDETSWELLLPSGQDHGLSALLRYVERAAVGIKLEQLQSSRKLAVFDPKERQSPETSTISAVRTLAWAAQLLGVPMPEIYARADDLPGGVAMAPCTAPTILLGKAALSGRTIPELAFILARELATMRAAGRLLTFFPSLGDLKNLITTAMGVVIGEAPRSRDPFAMLSVRMDGSSRQDLAEIAGVLTRERAKLDVADWVRCTELTACRAGLLVCDDITVAARMLAVDGRAIPGLSAADRIKDLSAYSVSQKYHALRSLTGIAARTRG